MDKAEDIKINNGMAALYQSKAAAIKASKTKVRKEGFIKRAIRFVKGLKAAKAQADAQPYCSAEDRRNLYTEVFKDACAPIYNAFENAADTLWSFLYRLWYDVVGIAEFVVNLVVKLAFYLGSFFIFIWDVLWDIALWLEARKRTLFYIFAGLMAVVVLALITVNSLTAYEYSYYGRRLGTAKSKEEVYKTIELLGDKLSENSGANINIDVERDIEFRRVFGLNQKIDSKDDILNTLTYMKDIHVQAYSIVVNGRDTVTLDKEETAKTILEAVKKSFAPEKEGLVYDTIEYVEDISIEEVNVPLAYLWRPGDAAKYLTTGSVRDLEEDEEPAPLVTVRTSGTITWEEEVGYGTAYVQDDTMYIDQVVLFTQGRPGLNRVVANVETINGAETERTEIAKTSLTAPINAVYHRGTRPIPERSGTGTWIFPVKGAYAITSGYGWRGGFGVTWADFHSGTDISQAHGSRIYAADGGVVVYAGWRGSYGLCVDISHGGNYTTRYAHCSRLLVAVGQEVAQGEVIALMGATGFVTGTHLHFEVLYNGGAFDPMTLFR